MEVLLTNLHKYNTGFLVDDITLHYYIAFKYFEGQFLTAAQLADLQDTTKTPMTLGGDQLAYGILVRDELVYNYFKKYAHDNWYQLDVCRRNFINFQMNKKKTLDRGNFPSVFSTEGGLFFQLSGVALG